MELIFGNATIITVDKERRIIADGAIAVLGDTIADLGKTAEIKKKYPGYKVENVIFFDDNEANDTDMMLYGIQFEDADNYFVELSKNNQTLVVQVNPFGEVFFFKQVR